MKKEWRPCTFKVEPLLNDMNDSEEMTEEFKAKITDEWIEPSKIELSASVLTDTRRPSAQSTAATERIDLPQRAAHCSSKFEKYYCSKHKNRRMTWKPTLSSIEIKAGFGEGTKAVDLPGISAYIICRLMLFNDSDCLNWRCHSDPGKGSQKII